MNILEMLRLMKEQNASDLYLKVGLSPSFRVHGVVNRLDGAGVSDSEMDSILQTLMTPHQRKLFSERPDLDFAYTLETGERYRINMFRQQGHAGLVARLIRDADLTFAHLHLPPVVQELAELPRGLVIVTGATGSGKSTTLAAIFSLLSHRCSRESRV